MFVFGLREPWSVDASPVVEIRNKGLVQRTWQEANHTPLCGKELQNASKFVYIHFYYILRAGQNFRRGGGSHLVVQKTALLVLVQK